MNKTLDCSERFYYTMITHFKVLVFLLSFTCGCLGNRHHNHRRMSMPVRGAPIVFGDAFPRNANIPILLPGSSGIHGSNGPPPHQPHHPPHHPAEILEIPQPTPSPKPVTSAPRLTEPAPKPACAMNLTCDAPCESDGEYNDNVRAKIDTLISANGGVNTLLKDPVLKTLLHEVVVPEEEAPSLRGGVIERAVCAGEEVIFFPERAKTENNEWAFVLNQGKVRQGIKYEKCISEGTKCSLGAVGSEVDTVCRQKYIYKKMLIMDDQGSKIVPEQVLMPSCCVCYIVKPFNGFGRIGSRNDTCH